MPPKQTDKLPSGSEWLHEIKHDGFRVIARKNGAQVRLYSRPGNDLTHRFPRIVEALACLRTRSAPRPHMQMSFQHRCHGIVGDCRQMKIDLDNYNDAHPDDEPIQMIFDFTMDLAELEAADAA